MVKVPLLFPCFKQHPVQGRKTITTDGRSCHQKGMFRALSPNSVLAARALLHEHSSVEQKLIDNVCGVYAWVLLANSICFVLANLEGVDNCHG